MERSSILPLGGRASRHSPSVPAAAGPRNAWRFYLPGGTCHEVGSNKDAPIVGAGNPNQSPGSNNQPGQLDLIPGSGDQYGARWAAENSPRLLPGNCP